MPSHPSINTNRVVVALLDGRRLKGYVYDFLPQGKTLNVFPAAAESGDRRPATVVEFAACKAIYFVRTHEGNAALAAAARAASTDPKRHPPRGKRVRVVFSDGEEMICCTEVYNASRLGFFVYPIDPRSNNLRIFIVNANVRHVLTGRSLDGTSATRPERESAAHLSPKAPPGKGVAEAAQDLKCEVALRVLHGEAPADLEQEYGLPAATISFWTRSFLQGGRGLLSGEGVTGEPATDRLVAELRNRVRDLEKEIARLKSPTPKVLARA